MSRSSMLIVLGVLTMLAPFSGLPVALRSLLALVFGACVLGMGLALRAESVQAVRANLETPPAPEPPPAAPTISPI